MCGIFAQLIPQGSVSNVDSVQTSFDSISNRGSDHHELKSIHTQLIFGFHRLSINDTSFKGNQPLHHPHKPYVLICNGEIYNYKALLDESEAFSNSDCEVILYLYEKYGIEKTLSLIDSEAFAFCLYDGEKNVLFVARDRFGVRPLFVGTKKNGGKAFSSEAKGLLSLSDRIEQFQPGCWIQYNIHNFHENESSYQRYYHYTYPIISSKNEDILCKRIHDLLESAVQKRLVSDRPIGCLLSGGLDSSIISAIVSKEFKKQNRGQLHTFSIGLKNSPDLYYARKVAKHIGSCHHHIECTEKEFLDAIPTVIFNIESYDTTTVRASVGNYLVGKYIHDHTDIKVVFNGDGSDEQSGYLYLKNAPTSTAFQEECKRLLQEIHFFDVLRSDRCLSSNFSLETRTPFLDTDFVNYYMSIPPELKMYSNTRMEKFLLRKAFQKELPEEVLWRPKEAFSDGCSSIHNSWHEIIKTFVDSQIDNDVFETERDKYVFNKPLFKESLYYRQIFEDNFKDCETLIPHYWLPKWCNQVDPSARKLDGYHQSK